MMKCIAAAITASIITLLASGQSAFDAKEAFNPHFYPYPGNEMRSAGGEPGPGYWQNQASYRINCTLDTGQKRITGSVDIEYVNNSPDNLRFLWLQLDQNIYKKDSRGSATTTEAGGRWANDGYTSGYIITAVEAESAGGKYAARYLINDTRMQVWLQEPLQAKGGKIKLSIPFAFTIPEYGTDRMGLLNSQHGWIYQIAQWFPRLCVYDDIQGWNVDPYLGAGEFFLEYGHIEYAITAPANLLVVGSGTLLNPSECFNAEELVRYNQAQESDKTILIRSLKDVTAQARNSRKGTITWKFSIENARDVAWAASGAFILDGARINLPSGKRALALSAYPAESAREKKEEDWRKSTEMVKASIEYYSGKWYEYPYTTAVNVAGSVGGMEYPGIVFCSYSSTGSSLWNVTDHEFGHTWFPMIVGSNERKYAWMDEGFNTFINDLSTEAFRNGVYNNANLFSNPSLPFMIQATFGDEMDAMFTSPDVIQQQNLGIAAYMKPAQMLHALRDVVLGPERFDAAFKEYIRRWAFKHPTPWDFFHTMENVGGEDLAWFWRGWIFNSWKLDQAVKEVKYVKNNPGNGAEITIENKEKMPMPVDLLIKESNGKEHRLFLPVEVWQRGATWTIHLQVTSEIKEIIIDPDKKLPDWNRENNRWKRAF